MTWARWYWPCALLAVLGILLGPEVYALRTNWRNTLSYWFWTLCNVEDHEALGARSFAWYITLALYIAVICVWLTFHLWFKWWRG